MEVQATAERSAFPREKLLEMMDHIERGIIELVEAQRGGRWRRAELQRDAAGFF